MPEWNLYGSERKNVFEVGLEPNALAATLKQYQRVLGKSFGISELLELEKIRALALVAEAINDAPEFLLDQIGKAMSDSRFHPVSDAIESVAEAIGELNI